MQPIQSRVWHSVAHAVILDIPLHFLLLLIVFRGLLAALLPLVVAVVTIALTLVGLRILAQFTTVSVFALNLATGLGFALAIDYSLILLSRFREEARPDRPAVDAISATV